MGVAKEHVKGAAWKRDGCGLGMRQESDLGARQGCGLGIRQECSLGM